MRRPKKRQLSVFLLSFLDIMAGGFGAVVLIFLIVDHNTVKTVETATQQQLAQVRLLDWEQKQGEERLADIRERVGILKLQIADARERVENLELEVDEKLEEVEEVERQALDQSETVVQLQSEIETDETELERIQRLIQSRDPSTIEIAGQGDRQYLTGLFLGGNRIVIALDSSASMLHDSIVNVLILRSHDVEAQLNSKKWIQAVDIVEWLVANVPRESQMQVAKYDKDATLLVDDGDWHDATDGPALVKTIDLLRNSPPANGTDLQSLFRLIGKMDPLPDNVFLITDGLPTLDDSNASRRRTTIKGVDRERLFLRALGDLPAGITVNVILLPFEGDPWAAGYYWALAHNTSGTFMTPSKDWP